MGSNSWSRRAISIENYLSIVDTRKIRKARDTNITPNAIEISLFGEYRQRATLRIFDLANRFHVIAIHSKAIVVVP